VGQGSSDDHTLLLSGTDEEEEEVQVEGGGAGAGLRMRRSSRARQEVRQQQQQQAAGAGEVEGRDEAQPLPGVPPAAPAEAAAVPPPPPPGLRRFVDVGLMLRLGVMAVLFFHGASPERMALASFALTFFYVARVGLLDAIASGITAPLRRLLDRRRAAAAAAAAAAPAAGDAAAAGAAPAAGAGPAAGAAEGGGAGGGAGLGDGAFFTPLLTLGRGFIICDLFAALAAFFVSLWPEWNADQQLGVEVRRIE
jgi:hypothetical protein